MVRKKRLKPRPQKRISRLRTGLRARGLELGILFLALILVVFVYSSVYLRWLSPVQERTLPVERKIVRVEVLNGCGAPGLAKEVTDYLRIKGYDVVNVGNAESFEFPETIVVDRVGDMTYAWQVARTLGVNNVIQQKDLDLLLEVTLILGKDYQDLELFQEILGGVQ
jgi:hypothetical protein